MTWVAIRRRRRRRMQLMRALHVAGLILILVAVAFVWIRVGRVVSTAPDSAKPLGTPKALAWGDRVFSTKAQLRIWLAERGITYSVWARKHTAAIAVLEHRAVAPTGTHVTASKPPRTHTSPPTKTTKTRTTPRPTTTTGRTAVKAPAVDSTTQATRSVTRGLVGAALWTVVLLLAALAGAPTALLARLSRRRIGGPHRAYFAAAAASIGVGLLLATLNS